MGVKKRRNNGKSKIDYKSTLEKYRLDENIDEKKQKFYPLIKLMKNVIKIRKSLVKKGILRATVTIVTLEITVYNKAIDWMHISVIYASVKIFTYLRTVCKMYSSK